MQIQQTTCPICECDVLAGGETLSNRMLAKCHSCGHEFASAYDKNELAEIYKRDYYANSNDERIDQWLAENRLVWEDLAKDLGGPEKTLLDVGAGTGGFIIEYKKLFPSTRVFAIESSNEACDALKKHIPDIEIIANDINDLADTTQKFSAIVCLQCFEHFFNPQHACNKMYELLEDSGRLLVAVPNRKSYQTLLKGKAKSLCYGNPTHLHFFDDSTMKKMLKNSGFSIIRRIVKFGGMGHKNIKAFAQYALRQLGISNELRYIVSK